MPLLSPSSLRRRITIPRKTDFGVRQTGMDEQAGECPGFPGPRGGPAHAVFVAAHAGVAAEGGWWPGGGLLGKPGGGEVEVDVFLLGRGGG